MTGEETLGTCVLVLTTDQAPLDRGLAQAKPKVEKAGADMQASMDKRLAGVSKSMGRAGSTMTRSVTVPVLALGAAAVKMGADFDAAMERVHTQSGASQKEVNALKGEVIALSKVSAFGPTDLANALYRLEGAGYRGAKAMSALRAASDLAAVGNANVEDTTKTLTQIMKPGIKGVKDFQDAVAQVNATVGAGDMKLPQLVDALGTGVVTSAKMAGLSLQDVTGALAVFGDETNNVSGWAAQFATALHFITNPTMKAAGALQSIGLQSDSLALDMTKPNGLVTALRDLQTHLDATFPKGSGHALSIDEERKALDTYKTTLQQAGVTGATLTKDLDKYKTKLKEFGSAEVAQAQVLGDMFPGGRGRVLSVLLNQVDLLQQKEKQIAGTTNTFAGDVAKTQETTAFKIHNDWAKIQADAVQLGETLGPTFLGVFGAVADEADKIATAFERLPAGAQKAIITGGLITAGIGPALKILSLFTGGIGRLITAEQFAQRLITGQRGLFGDTMQPGQTSATARLASMQVGELVVANMVGGGVGGAAGSAAAAEGAVAGETRSAGGVILPRGVEAPVAAEVPTVVPGGAGLGSTLRGAAGRAVGGAMVGVTGLAISQIVGSEVHGAVGSAIKEIGSDASIGAGVGAVFGPAGMAGGAIIGGLVGTFKHFFSGKDFGQTVAGNVFKGGFGGAKAPDLSKQLAAALDELHQFTTKTVAGRGVRGSVITDTVHLDLTKLTGVDQAKALAAANKAGKLVARQLEAGWDQYEFQSEPIMFSQLRSQLKKLPPEAQATALQSAINFSLTLERQGRVAKGSTERMLKQAESAFPGFTRYLGITATAGVQQFTKALDLSKAETNLQGQLHKMSQDFPQVQQAMADTTGGIQDKATAAVKALKRIQTDGTGPMRRQATADLAQLRASTAKDLDAMGAEVTSKSRQMKRDVENNTGGAAKIAATNMSNFSAAVISNINSGAVGAGQGMNILLTNLNKALKEMGQKQLSPIQVASMKLNVGKQQQLNARANAARGGLWQFGRHGQRGQDSIPVDFGDQRIMVAPGEQGLVLTHQQQAFLNRRTADVGGLGGMFRKLNQRHGMAGGGFVADPGTVQNVGDLPQITSRLGALGRALDVIVYGISGYRSPAHSVAVGGFSDDPHTRGEAEDIGVNSQSRASAAQLSRAILAKYGLDRPFDESDDPSNSEVNHIQLLAGAAKVAAGIAGASTGTGGGIPQISAPHVAGSGVMATLVKAALGKGTAGANAYLGKFASGPTGAGGPVPAGVVRNWLTQALKTTGHFSQANLSALFGRTMQESSGNPRAINLWDSNAKAGHPSKGLLQTIDSTFNQYALPGHGDIWNPVDDAIAAIRYMFADYGHIVGPSGSGYARGGIIPGFSKGGAPVARSARRAKPTRRTAKPKGAKPLGATLKIPGGGDQDISVINRELGSLNALTGDSGDVARLGELLSYWPSEWSISNPLLGQDASSFIVTTDALGNSVTPFIDTASVNLSAGELQQELGWETGTVGDLRTALLMVRRVMPLIKAAIKKRQAALAALKKQIRDNLAKIALLRQNIADLGNDPAVADLRKQINSAGTTPQSLTSLKQQLANAEKIEAPSGKGGDARRAARDALVGSLQSKIYAAERGQKVTVTDLRNKLIDVESGDKQKKAGYESQITGLETLNQQLGGDKTAVGTAGKIGPLNTQLSNLNSSLATVSGDTGTIAGASGLGGELGPALIQEDTLRAEIAQLGTGPLGQALAAAAAAAAPGTTGTTGTTTLDGLSSQLQEWIALSTQVTSAQSSVFSQAIGSLPKFGGSFATGGIVPGVMGEPRMIRAHGKEEVLTAQESAERRNGDGDRTPHAIFTMGRGVEDLIDARIEYVNRNDVATARRRLPGRPGKIR